MNELHFYRMENLLKVVEALAREKYNFKIETSSNGTWSIIMYTEQDEHTQI